MKRVYVGADAVTAGLLQSALEARGIACLLRNQYLAGGAGELPPTACWPELWVLDERDEVLAQRLIAGALPTAPAEGPAWTCSCGEALEPQFGQCWRCGAWRDEG